MKRPLGPQRSPWGYQTPTSSARGRLRPATRNFELPEQITNEIDSSSDDPESTVDLEEIENASAVIQQQTINREKTVPSGTDVKTFRKHPISSDINSIKQHFVGKNLLVNISNLVEPAPEKKVRDIDYDHLRRLEEEYRKSGHVFTVLIGNETSLESLEELQQPGKGPVETTLDRLY
ncbi:unnamed protein product [Mytilus coruscus]|uniref:Uncharacterized protein n=1 Tax=Mytilus coruscus TaxID=42192 RepID=A0A6J8DW79_MYTCO|nr:unnamed protein product [Mytilus coruscus]